MGSAAACCCDWSCGSPAVLALVESTATATVKQPEKVAATRQEIFQGEYWSVWSE